MNNIAILIRDMGSFFITGSSATAVTAPVIALPENPPSVTASINADSLKWLIPRLKSEMNKNANMVI